MFAICVKDKLCEICEASQRSGYLCQKIYCNNEFYDFDKIIEKNWQNFGVFFSCPSSCDALYPYNANTHFLFVEIKYRDWTCLQEEEEKIKFFKKFYDTLLAIYLYDSKILCNFVVAFSPFKNNKLLCDDSYKEKSRILKFLKTEFGRFKNKEYYEITSKDIICFYNKKAKQRINLQDDIILRFKSFEPLACSEIDNYIDEIENIE